jgi:hypothetical protein
MTNLELKHRNVSPKPLLEISPFGGASASPAFNRPQNYASTMPRIKHSDVFRKMWTGGSSVHWIRQRMQLMVMILRSRKPAIVLRVREGGALLVAEGRRQNALP